MATNHNYYSSSHEKGKCYWLKAFEVPEGDTPSKGRAIQNLISIAKDDKILAYIKVKTLDDGEYLRPTSVALSPRRAPSRRPPWRPTAMPARRCIVAINILEGDKLVTAVLANDDYDVIIATRDGYRHPLSRASLRARHGPQGQRRARHDAFGDANDEVVGMVLDAGPEHVKCFVVCEKGYGKRTPSTNTASPTGAGKA